MTTVMTLMGVQTYLFQIIQKKKKNEVLSANFQNK